MKIGEELREDSRKNLREETPDSFLSPLKEREKGIPQASEASKASVAVIISSEEESNLASSDKDLSSESTKVTREPLDEFKKNPQIKVCAGAQAYEPLTEHIENIRKQIEELKKEELVIPSSAGL